MTCWLIRGWVSLGEMAQPPSARLTARKGMDPWGGCAPGRVKECPCYLYLAVCSALCCEGCLVEGAYEGGCSLEELERRVGTLCVTRKDQEVRPKT